MATGAAPMGRIDVGIVGAGPVGLFLGVLLLQQGLKVRILERREGRSGRSRAIGIHPPALAVLDRAGLAGPLVSGGIRIPKGVAYSRGRKVAELPFQGDPGFPYILAVPQPVTEQVLEQAVVALDPEAVIRGADVRSFIDDGDAVTIRAAGPDGDATFECRFLAAADGAHSLVRRRLMPRLGVRRYPDSYLMGDFADGTGHGNQAVLYLEPDGIVESFPLPGGIRRWVARLGAPDRGSTAGALAALITARTGVPVDPSTTTMLSAFEVQSRIAPRMVHGRVMLLGDAAHEISPIGGQGMNLGWLDAASLAPVIGAALREERVDHDLPAWEKERIRAASRASFQAGLNMVLGRPMQPALLSARNRLFASALKSTAVAGLVESRFTMRGRPSSPPACDYPAAV
ncbi:FAD-dependent oxidoreductase [Paenarthrobacter sp. NCHU4564]|uniref:FAD-dependent oxidoreductase n=1 Tax=Paenarthrobacter sp. NCHU4564 TaxID=3451353 RepID=UPI003F9BA2D5